MITTSYDPEVDALFVRFGADGAVSVRTDEVAPGVMIDFDAAGNPIGVEVLNAHARINGQGSLHVDATVVRKPTAAQP